MLRIYTAHTVLCVFGLLGIPSNPPNLAIQAEAEAEAEAKAEDGDHSERRRSDELGRRVHDMYMLLAQSGVGLFWRLISESSE